MPCGCARPIYHAPDNLEWGPVFWKLLHGLAEYSGNQKDPIMKADELLLWKNLLTTLHTALPCEECRNHLKQYVELSPIVIPDKYEELGQYVRKWLYDLHEAVNQRLGKTAFLQENIKRDTNLKNTFGVLNVIMKRAIQASSVSMLAWMKWSKYARFLYGMY